METKCCTKCGEVKGLGEFYHHRKGLNGLCSACKSCMIKAGKAYAEKNKEKRRELNTRWRENNRDKSRAAVHRWRVENKEKYLEGLRLKGERGVFGLRDQYVKRFIGKESPPELIEAKRQQLLVHRALREFQKFLKEQTK